MKSTVRYAMIGCGMMGQEHLRNLALIEGAEVTVVFEPDAGMREATRALVPQAVWVKRRRAPGIGNTTVSESDLGRCGASSYTVSHRYHRIILQYLHGHYFL